MKENAKAMGNFDRSFPLKFVSDDVLVGNTGHQFDAPESAAFSKGASIVSQTGTIRTE
jgi:hypothetical protein